MNVVKLNYLLHWTLKMIINYSISVGGRISRKSLCLSLISCHNFSSSSLSLSVNYHQLLQSFYLLGNVSFSLKFPNDGPLSAESSGGCGRNIQPLKPGPDVWRCESERRPDEGGSGLELMDETLTGKRGEGLSGPGGAEHAGNAPPAAKFSRFTRCCGFFWVQGTEDPKPVLQ